MLRIWKSLTTTLCLALGLLATSAPARAGFTADLIGAGHGGSGVSVSYPGAGAPNPWSGFAGQIMWDVLPNGSSIAGLTDANGRFNTFCIQLGQYALDPQTFNARNLATLPDAGAASPMGATRALLLRELFAERFTSLTVSGNTAQTNLNHQAFQLAVWEIVYETNSILKLTGPNQGVLYASGHSATTLANGWLKTLAGQSGDAGYTQGYLGDGTGDVTQLANLVGLQGVNGQDQVAVLQPGFGPGPGGDIEPVPAPPAVVLALAGVLPCLALRRRLRNRDA
jgi:hypothetical protein